MLPIRGTIVERQPTSMFAKGSLRPRSASTKFLQCKRAHGQRPEAVLSLREGHAVSGLPERGEDGNAHQPDVLRERRFQAEGDGAVVVHFRRARAL
jgi:hypothetical protein